jgi:hypothetical protein
MKRYIYIPLHGGLGDQIKKLYAGILVGRELKVSKILIDFSLNLVLRKSEIKFAPARITFSFAFLVLNVT